MICRTELRMKLHPLDRPQQLTPAKRGFNQRCPGSNGARCRREMHTQTKQTRSATQMNLPPRRPGTKLAPSMETAEQQHRGWTCFTLTFEEQGTTPAQSVPPPARHACRHSLPLPAAGGSVTPRCSGEADVTPNPSLPAGR